ncbi:unnamed protein product [Lactuca saligna]|uniref:Uncharacterized protein n=1 Tax=Lactuca saligna TaxID=75948 RepID=A0AA35ZJI9_LACSI|nr:unnamed protein product [Lactuca saligna]
MFNHLSKDEQKFKPIVAHLRRMLISYILEVWEMDVELAVVLRNKPFVLPKEALKDISKMKLGRIHRDNWSVAFQQSDRDGMNVHKCLSSLRDKHLYSTSCLNYIMSITKQCKLTMFLTRNALRT